jgi:hypothetical protein
MKWPKNIKYQVDGCIELIDKGRIVSFDRFDNIAAMIGSVLDYYPDKNVRVQVVFESVGANINVVPVAGGKITKNSTTYDQTSRLVEAAHKLEFTRIYFVANKDGSISTAVDSHLEHLLAGSI